MPRTDPTTELVLEALSDYLEHGEVERLGAGLVRVTGRLRADEPHDELLPFLEEVAADACGEDVIIDCPLISPEVPDSHWVKILQAADRREDIVQVRLTGPGQVSVIARHQPLTLGSKRNRLPKLVKALPGLGVDAQALGRCVDVAELKSIPAAQAFFAPYFVGVSGLDGAEVHHVKLDARRQGIKARVDCEQASPATLLRVGRAIRNDTDLDVRLEHRIAAHRARSEAHAAFEALPWLDKVKTRWIDKAGSVQATVEAEHARSDALQAMCERLTERLGVPVSFRFDTGRSFMVDRIVSDFPADGILTGIRHVDGTLYEVEALLPLEDPSELERWSDAMESKWGLQIVLSDAFLRAPDVRYRDALGADRESIANRYNRPHAFPAEVQAEAQAAVAALDIEAEAERRRDLRETVVISIDPARTRDLDDALSLTALDDGSWQVGVHIADVGSFVPQGSALDDEALSRSFTTYLAEGEIPVLPEVLANEAISLHGGQDSLALSLLIRLDDEANVLGYEPVHTVIHNHCRLNYSQAQAILDGADHQHAAALRTLDRLAKRLRAGRKDSGALDLNLQPDPEKASHQLIEEFMLLANDCVSRFLEEHHPLGLCLYRTHPHVPGTQWGPLNNVAHYLRADTKVTDQGSMQAALEELLGTPSFEIFRFHVGRVLEKAIYHVEQLGHGALAKEHYAHFTSPIRRYSDLIVHRLIDDALAWGQEPRDADDAEAVAASSYLPGELLPVCDHLNAMEIRVDAASFESHRLSDLQRFESGGRSQRARILGLMRGRVSLRVEGSDLPMSVRYRSERRVEDEMPLAVDDELTGMSLRLGQEVSVKTKGVDWGRKSIDAIIVGS